MYLLIIIPILCVLPAGELSAKELLTLAGNEAGVDLARSLLTRNMDLLHRMGLVSSVVPVEVSAAGVVGTLHGGNASAYVLRQQGVYEEPEAAPASRGAADSNPSGSDGDGDADEDEEEHPAGAAQLKKLCHEFDITTESGREAYWLSMEFMVVCAPITGARQRGMVDSSLLLKCFPFVNAPEAASDRTWIGRNGATQEQLALVRPELKRFGQEHMTWREALAIAQRLNVPFEAVARAVVTKRSFGQGKATGRGAQRLGGLRVTREKSTVQRRRRRAKEEEVELEEDEEAEVVRPEVRRAPQAPERKRKWYAEEDRELLHAWAKWLGQNGPDKILKWSILKYRPRFAKAASCRYRLANLKAHPEMGAHVLKIQQLAAGVHSRRVLRQAAAEEDGHAADPNASPQGVETAAPGSKRGRGAGAPGGAKAKRAKGSPGGAAPAPIDVSNLPELFEIHDAADAQALKEVMEEVEIVVAGAPNRHKARSLRIQAKSSSRPGPMAKGSLALPIAGPAGGGRMLPLLRQWARAAAVAKASRAAGELPPTVAAAMDLVRSLLHPAAPQDEDAKTALAARFSDDDVKQAVLQLVRLNHVSVPEATGAAPEAAFTLSLSSKYKSETEPLFFLRNVLAEASQAAARVRRRAQAADERALSVMPSSNPNAPGPNGGTVAGLISMLAGGAAQLSASLPVASHLRAPRQPPTDVDALVDPDATAEEEEVLRVLSKVKVSATALPAAAASSHDDTATGSGSSVSHIKLSSPEEVLYQPSLVATDDALREEAEKACKKVFASRKIAGGARGAAALLHALQAAGAKGVSPSVCAAALPAGSDVDEAAATLCRFGLARKVDTFDGACLMSAAASQALLAFPPPALDNAASAHVTGEKKYD